MKHFNLVILVCGVFLIHSAVRAQGVQPYYKHQFGFEIGHGGCGEDKRPFMWAGAEAGFFYRYSNHQIGVRASYFSEAKIPLFTSINSCKTINLYYGFAYATRRFSITPQIGGGWFNSERIIRNEWHRYNLQASLHLSYNNNGMGLYLRPYYTWNPHQQYLGIALGVMLGRAFNL